MLHRILFIASIFIIFIVCPFCGCKKHTSKPANPVDQLPAATQTGANTFGCLVNGKPWIPTGNNGSPNLTDSYDPFYNRGVMGVSAYRIISDADREYFSFGIIDSMNFIKTPKFFQLTNSGLFRVTYTTANVYDFRSYDDTTYCAGSLTLTKFDTSSHIMAGTFTVTLASPSTDTIKITDGRFDVLF